MPVEGLQHYHWELLSSPLKHKNFKGITQKIYRKQFNFIEKNVENGKTSSITKEALSS
jgi:plasmid replication initiation protein